jgi:hypothetical protein
MYVKVEIVRVNGEDRFVMNDTCTFYSAHFTRVVSANIFSAFITRSFLLFNFFQEKKEE